MREVSIWAAILAAALSSPGVGCGCETVGAKGELGLMHAASRHPGRLDWKSLSMEEIITLFSRSDPGYEKALLGGLDADISLYACDEMERRMGEDGLNALTPEHRNRLVRAVRAFLSDRRYWGSRTMLAFAAKYDPEQASQLFLKHRELMDYCPEIAFAAISRAGAEDEAWAVIAPRLNAADEQEVCNALRLIRTGQLKIAADEVFKRTNARRWMIRLEGLHTLDQLDDSRASDALQAHLGDIKRCSIGFRVFSWPYAMQAMMVQEQLRTELIKALVRREVPGAPAALESMVLNPWQGKSVARMAAGVGLAMLDRERGVAALKRLLKSGNENEQFIGTGIASHGLAPDVKKELEQVAETSPYEMPREAAAQALWDLKGWKDLPPEMRQPFF